MSEITLLDGGMGQELVHRAGDNPTPLWSTRVMIDNPGMVADVHRDFTAAGATTEIPTFSPASSSSSVSLRATTAYLVME